MVLKGLKGKKFYFIGIGGISMSALAKLLKTSGYIVSGSDGARGEETENLAFYGIKAYIGVDGTRKELVEADTVVYTDAIASDNAELLTAKRLQKRISFRWFPSYGCSSGSTCRN